MFGGSQGAQRLNAMVPQALSGSIPRAVLRVRHQAGARGLDAARAAYLALDVEAEVLPFIEDMAAAYSWADLALCRAGAMTIAELEAAGLGALLVPLAAATDDHQTAQRRSAAAGRRGPHDAGARSDAGVLCGCDRELTRDRARLLGMAHGARARRAT